MAGKLWWVGASGTLVTMIVGGCTGAVEESGAQEAVTTQNAFDFTVIADREMFRPEGLVYREAVGPYAVFEVQSSAPRLIGPTVQLDHHSGGLVMLCGGSAYFTPDGAEAGEVELELRGVEDRVLVQSQVAALRMGDCAESDDQFTERLPPADPSGGVPDLPTGEPLPAEVDSEGLALTLSPPPPIGSLVLIRRIGLAVPERVHNESHIIPDICCDGDYCALEAQ